MRYSPLFLGLCTPLTLLAEESSTMMSAKQIFSSSPIIYSVLLCMSICSLCIWLYSLIILRKKDFFDQSIVSQIRKHMLEKRWSEALGICYKNNSLLSKMVASAIELRGNEPQHIVNTMEAEGKRESTGMWQRISLLNDIVLISPMLGLLGTVIGLFYALYDVNRSVASITALFDGLGIAVGTTVAGLIVSILTMIFSSTLKHKLIKTLHHVENEALDLSKVIQQNKH